MDAQALHDKAEQAAQAAVDALIAEHGLDHKAFLFCGTAWVTIKPARGAFVQFLKNHRRGNTGVYGGYEIAPNITIQGPQCQSETLREAANRAYAAVLQAEGIHCTVHTYAS